MELLTEDLWLGNYTKLDNMFGEIFSSEGMTHTPFGEDDWVNICAKLNSDFSAMFNAKGGSGRQNIENTETWGDVTDKVNSMFTYLYSLMGGSVTFTVLDNNSQPISGVDVFIEEEDLSAEPIEHAVEFTVLDSDSQPIEDVEVNIIQQ